MVVVGAIDYLHSRVGTPPVLWRNRTVIVPLSAAATPANYGRPAEFAVAGDSSLQEDAIGAKLPTVCIRATVSPGTVVSPANCSTECAASGETGVTTRSNNEVCHSGFIKAGRMQSMG